MILFSFKCGRLKVKYWVIYIVRYLVGDLSLKDKTGVTVIVVEIIIGKNTNTGRRKGVT